MSNSEINRCLENIAKYRTDPIAKGEWGEEAVVALVRQFASRAGGFAIQGFRYPYGTEKDGVTRLGGNIHQANGEFYDIGSSDSTTDEIDVLYVSPHKVYIIEVKARTGNWMVFDHWSRQSSRLLDKCPVQQTEKHCRHLYSYIHNYIPAPEYLVPILVFVDESTVEDARVEYRDYIHVTILNNLANILTAAEGNSDVELPIEKLKDKLLTFGSGKML